MRYKYNKYHNIKTKTSDGIEHDSRTEARRWNELKLLERAKEITDLQRQVKFVLIPAQRDGKKLIERECAYIADYTYKDKQGNLHVEDAKGYKDGGAYRIFVIKRKLMLYVHGIKIEEV